ncbi:MAG: LysR family transcriptional regulator [Burkholderiaceae bacterium]
MRFNKLDLNLLVALDAMLTERNISRAAERLHLSQSAMSNALGRLRDYFGDELLVPVGRRMALTPRAEALQESVRELLVRVETTIAVQPEFEPDTSDRVFRLFVSDYTVFVLMPHVLALAAAQAPGLRFDLLPQMDQPHRALERGEIDLLIIPEGFCSPEHPSEVIFEDRFDCVVWQGSALAREPLTLETYLDAGHVVVRTGRTQQSYEEEFLKSQGIARRIEVTTTSFAAPPHLVVGTERIATVHHLLAGSAARHLPLACVPPPIEIPPLQQAVQWHKYRSDDPGLRWVRNLLAEAAARMRRHAGA